MNPLQLLARRLRQAFAVFRDPDAGLLLPLPEPAVDPRVNAERLAEEARRQGLADGRKYLYDGWSFGHDNDPPDAVLDPEYVLGLRHQCQSAVHEHRDRQKLTDARLADLHLVVRDSDRTMRAARDRMARVAARDQLGEDDSLRAFMHRRNINADALELPPLDHPVWEGEAPPMPLIWRVLIVLFLTAVVFEIEHYVTQTYLPVTGLGGTTTLLMTLAMAGLTIVGPLVSGQLFRNRHATGYDRVMGALTFLLLVPTLAIILGFGLLAARLFDHGVTAGAGVVGASRSAALGLTPATLIVVFDVVLFLACAMAYILGLAQRHPFQQAFARSRQMRNRTVHLSQRMGTRINGDYRATTVGPMRGGIGDEPDEDPPAPEPDRELAIQHAYLAAEDAYYQGLIEAVADPTFTEAVMRRRNRRTALPAPRPAPEPAPVPAAVPEPQPEPQPQPEPVGDGAAA
ncbi:hypothetical protein [Dactylosporangium sp. NPDC005555]|uniref:hypothetical protein n=1 Tax=Dactylosporangium sp. NPDC005555 TaxID=3154889 RepID=UPI0033A7982C